MNPNYYKRFDHYKKNAPFVYQQNFQISQDSDRMVINKTPRREPKIVNINSLKKFELLENRVKKYLSDFVKTTEKQADNEPSDSDENSSEPEQSTSNAGWKNDPIVAYPAKIVEEQPPIIMKKTIPYEVEKIHDMLPTNLEKKINDIEEKTKNIQKYNQILEERYKKTNADDSDKYVPKTKRSILEEVKNLESIMEKKFNDGQAKENNADYQQCHFILQECIDMLNGTIKEEKNDNMKLIEVPYSKKKDLTEPKQFKNFQDLSDDEFFRQYNLNLYDDDELEADDNDDEKEVVKGLNYEEYAEQEEDVDREMARLGLHPMKNVASEDDGLPGMPQRAYKNVSLMDADEIDATKTFKCDKEKLFQIKDELAHLEQNNMQFLSTLTNLKSTLKMKNLEEDDVNGYEFAEDISKMNKFTKDFEESEKLVDRLIRKINKHTRYNI
ncbi:unnamed protein product [Phyllotreta striolata]|uniref:Uncharacterized protein n=1 Tax=Phyllotreta striolata TaxID=444603 RepID=A0A9N9XQP6_PHYSR|nr:unnamed protein product [Phyllotreta striolata]